MAWKNDWILLVLLIFYGSLLRYFSFLYKNTGNYPAMPQ